MPLPVVLPDDPRVRDLRVPGRTLGAYDALARSGDKKTGRRAVSDLRDRLRALGLLAASAALDDLVALATKKRWGPTEILEHVADIEEKDRARRGLERRMSRSRLEKFKPMADFDWNWPTAIDRPSSNRCSRSTSSRAPATSSSSPPAAWARR